MDNRLKILNHLGRHPGETFTMLALSHAVRIPYATFYRTLARMGDFVIVKTVGHAKTLALNRNHPTIKAYLTVSSQEAKMDFLAKQPLIRKIAAELDTADTVILFGSFAKCTARPASDIDLLIINKDGGKSLSFSKYEVLFKRAINPIFVKDTEFIGMLHHTDENVGTQALNDHVILANPERFWECVLHG